MSVIVKMNGAFSHILALLEPEKIAEESEGFWDKLNGFADGVVAKETEWLFRPIGEALKDGIMGVFHLINMHSIEIITLGVITGAIGMMIGPLMGSTSARWFGRVMFVMLVGSVWRLILV
jgi:hypothetical protein